MSQNFQSCKLKAERWLERGAEVFRADYPPGSRIEYTRGDGSVMATVIEHAQHFGLNTPRVRVRGDSGREYWIGAERVIA